LQETAENQKETEQIVKKNAKQIKELQKTVDGMANNQGAFAEEYFFNSFENGKTNFFGEKFDIIKKILTNVWQVLEDEYDIVYVVGRERNGDERSKYTAKFWKNSIPQNLSSNGNAISIYVSGNNVYVARNEGGIAKFWKNNVPQNLTDETKWAGANSVFVK
jgi:hypothetical protein